MLGNKLIRASTKKDLISMIMKKLAKKHHEVHILNHNVKWVFNSLLNLFLNFFVGVLNPLLCDSGCKFETNKINYDVRSKIFNYFISRTFT